VIITGPRFEAAEKIAVFAAIVASGRIPAKADVANFLILYGSLSRQPHLPAKVANAVAQLFVPQEGRGRRKPETEIKKFLTELAAVNHARILIAGGTPAAGAWEVAGKKYSLNVGRKSLENLHNRIKTGTVKVPHLVLMRFTALA
jgi:hypothetical protein